MKAHLASLINAILLVTLGAWGYLESETPSITALIPVGVGVVLLAVNPGVKKEEKIQAHVAVLLTLIILLGLAMPLKGAIERGSTAGVVRVLVMILSSLFAMVTFVRSFIQARKNRESQGQKS